MTTETEQELARIMKQSLEAKVEEHINWAWKRYQEEALDLGRDADKELYCELADLYIQYKTSLIPKRYKRK